jgi:hypothetical protein
MNYQPESFEDVEAAGAGAGVGGVGEGVPESDVVVLEAPSEVGAGAVVSDPEPSVPEAPSEVDSAAGALVLPGRLSVL